MLAALLFAAVAPATSAAQTPPPAVTGHTIVSTGHASPVQIWRSHARTARLSAQRRAGMVGYHVRFRAYEQHTSSIGYLRWLTVRFNGVAAHYRRAWNRVYPHLMCIHSHEGAWTAYNPAGYYGGLQMDWSFMHTYGADKLRKYHGHDARYWAPVDQITAAIRAVRSRGYTPWSTSAAACGLY
jgi:hypothetical protein